MVSSPSPETTPAAGPRQHPFWIDGFLQLTDGIQSPLIFRKWAAIACVAGALERKVYVRAFKRILYPNLYILLTGGPGVGKTESLREVHRLWDQLPDIHTAPSSVSRASLIDELNSATRTVFRPFDREAAVTKFNSLQVAATEFGTFLTQYETEFMSTLNDLYDCVRYKERKRHMKEPIDIPNPQLTIIAGTTPAWLGGTLPETAWAEGFSSRLMLIYSGERVKVDPWALATDKTQEESALFADFKQIHSMFGQMMFEPAVEQAFRAWYMADCAPIPEHPRLEHYLPRRHIHFMKVCMVMSACRAPDYVIRLEDYQRAMDFFLEAEATMPEVFKAMRYNSDSNVIDEAFNFVYTLYVKDKKPISEHRIIRFLSERMPSHQIQKVLEVMVQSGVLKVAGVGTGLGGRNSYEPVARSLHGG